MKDNFEEA